MSFLTFWLTALVVWSQPGSATAATARDLTVLDAVIAQHVRAHAHPPVDTNWSHPWLVVFDRTYRFCDADLKTWCMPDETRAQLEEWIAQERDGASLNRAFVTRNHAVLTVSDPAPDATVVAASDDLEGLGDDLWRAFPRRYPEAHGWFGFSSPAYGDSGDAIVYVTYACGTLCGEGWLIHLSPVGSGWRIVGSLSIWQS